MTAAADRNNTEQIIATKRHKKHRNNFFRAISANFSFICISCAFLWLNYANATKRRVYYAAGSSLRSFRAENKVHGSCRRKYCQGVFNPRAQMEATFAPFYTENRWGDPESVSGPGSTLTRTSKLRSELPVFWKEIGARTLLDAPCGDFNWMKDTRLVSSNTLAWTSFLISSRAIKISMATIEHVSFFST